MRADFWLLVVTSLVVGAFTLPALLDRLDRPHEIGEAIDSLNGVEVYHNGSFGNVSGRNTAPDGYNLGLRYQCVEFVKRYYFERFDHRMPDSYGHARDFFDPDVSDGALNRRRNLLQYTNRSRSRPEVDDLLVLDGTLFNKFGHVAIVSKVSDTEIEIVQQNTGSSRQTIGLEKGEEGWYVEDGSVLGWLRKN